MLIHFFFHHVFISNIFRWWVEFCRGTCCWIIESLILLCFFFLGDIPQRLDFFSRLCRHLDVPLHARVKKHVFLLRRKGEGHIPPIKSHQQDSLIWGMMKMSKNISCKTIHSNHFASRGFDALDEFLAEFGDAPMTFCYFFLKRTSTHSKSQSAGLSGCHSFRIGYLKLPSLQNQDWNLKILIMASGSVFNFGCIDWYLQNSVNLLRMVLETEAGQK